LTHHPFNEEASMPSLKSLMIVLVGLAFAAASSACGENAGNASDPGKQAAAAMPAWVQRGLPGEGHARLEPLVGTFKQHKMIYGTLGRDPSAPPLVSDSVTTTRQWVAGGRFLEDTSEGAIDGQPYWRKGWLGYSTMDARFEWVTIDAVNTTMMFYLGEPGTGIKLPASMSGRFTDQGVVGEATVGKSLGMRTVIAIEGSHRHTFELYFTPPGGKEFLADRTVYTRITP
jgi:hypothetical protein